MEHQVLGLWEHQLWPFKSRQRRFSPPALCAPKDKKGDLQIQSIFQVAYGTVDNSQQFQNYNHQNTLYLKILEDLSWYGRGRL